jgi:hypothetical protein
MTTLGRPSPVWGAQEFFIGPGAGKKTFCAASCSDRQDLRPCCASHQRSSIGDVRRGRVSPGLIGEKGEHNRGGSEGCAHLRVGQPPGGDVHPETSEPPLAPRHRSRSGGSAVSSPGGTSARHSGYTDDPVGIPFARSMPLTAHGGAVRRADERALASS